MDPLLFFFLCLAGAAGLYLLIRSASGRARRPLRGAGIVLGLGGFGGLALILPGAVGPTADGDPPTLLILGFGVLAIASAVRLIATTKPVYAALYFVLVVICGCGLFLLMQAEFMAFALVIIYAGAILITYMFVLMLAQQSPDPDDPDGQAPYDLAPREPMAGAVVGFLLLALLSRTALDGVPGATPRVSTEQSRLEAWNDLAAMPKAARRAAERALELPRGSTDGLPPRVEPAADGLTAAVTVTDADGRERTATLSADAVPNNTQRVGIAMIRDFPASLEIAGVILLMAMFGAVILARRQIELTEDEKREAAGLRRFGHHDEPGAPAEGAP